MRVVFAGVKDEFSKDVSESAVFPELVFEILDRFLLGLVERVICFCDFEGNFVFDRVN